LDVHLYWRSPPQCQSGERKNVLWYFKSKHLSRRNISFVLQNNALLNKQFGTTAGNVYM